MMNIKVKEEEMLIRLTNCSKKPKEMLVAVAMSGGVDSSVVAGLLHEAGYNVIGITLQLYDAGMVIGKKGACCAGIDVYDAKMVASHLDIPHYVLDYESKFRDAVIEDFADTYIRGETPTPCIRCNQSVKFKDLLKVAKDLGADCLATGHYVSKVKNLNVVEMHKGLDITKDQSYFLFATTKEQLEYLEFPLGCLNKTETRKHAKRLGLKIAHKPDSQDICFVNGSYHDVVAKMRPNAFVPGPIMHVDGYQLGTHLGIIKYTVGQRKGIGISFSEPLYVVKIDAELNIVYVGTEKSLFKNRFLVKDVNFLGFHSNFEDGYEVRVKVRSTQMEIDAKLYHSENNNSVIVELFMPEKAIAPGQACVFYSDTRLLGGGWIVIE